MRRRIEITLLSAVLCVLVLALWAPAMAEAGPAGKLEPPVKPLTPDVGDLGKDSQLPLTPPDGVVPPKPADPNTADLPPDLPPPGSRAATGTHATIRCNTATMYGNVVNNRGRNPIRTLYRGRHVWFRYYHPNRNWAVIMAEHPRPPDQRWGFVYSYCLAAGWW